MYHIEPYSHNGGLTVDVNLHDNLVMCSFLNDSITNGSYITFKRLLRDEFPIVIYYVAPDSIFILDSNVKEVKSQGFNIFNVEEVFELSKEYETYTITECGETYDRPYPTYYIISTSTDTLRAERVSFIHDFTYRIEIHNVDISVWNADWEVMK